MASHLEDNSTRSNRSLPKVAIVVVNWNRRDDAVACLRSLQQISYPNYRIILVDNGSTDGSAATVRSQFPDVQVIELPENLRFAGGNNAALRQIIAANDDFALLLNNDTVVSSDFLDHLIETAQNDQQIGLVGPKIFYHQKPEILWFAGGVLKPTWGYARHLGLRQQDSAIFSQRREVSFLTGCCLLIRRELLINIGLLDEGFYLYNEDADYCLRTVKAGYKLVYEPKAIIYHKVSLSSGGAYSLKKWRHRYGSLFRLVRKHTSPLTWLLFFLNVIWEFISLPVNAWVQTRRLPPSKPSQTTR
ncbi:MAG: glycosyltransferase family 2 protein [bacterium]